MAKLIYSDGSGVSQEIELESRATLGRSPDQSIQILDRVVSKEHAVIERTANGNYFLRDLGSRNGTYVNTTKLDKSMLLVDGDEIRIGTTVLLFSQDSRYTDATKGGASSKDRKSSHDKTFQPATDISDESVLRSDYERLRILHDISRLICLGTNRDTILEEILTILIEWIPADRALIFLRKDIAEETRPKSNSEFDPLAYISSHHDLNAEERSTAGELSELEDDAPPSHELELALGRVVNQANPDRSFQVSHTVLSLVASTKEAILSDDAMVDTRLKSCESVILDKIHSLMAIPLDLDNDVIGVIYLDSTSKRGMFSEKDLSALVLLGHQVSLMLEHLLLLKRRGWEMLARQFLYQLLPPKIAKDVLAGTFELKSIRRYVTVMFVDIRGFAKMSESLEPEELVDQLNSYFEAMVGVISKNSGVLDKLIGDEIMVVWGAPVENVRGPEQAVCCAFEMLEALRIHNEHRLAQNLEPIEVGIGINSGDAIAGCMGISKSFDYTVTGDTVNVAARLCEKARAGEILVGVNTWSGIQKYVDGFCIEDKRLRGKSDEVEIYKITRWYDQGRDAGRSQTEEYDAVS